MEASPRPWPDFRQRGCLLAETREWLERRQREVGLTAVGCHGSVANEAVLEDLGWSSFEAREASSKISFRGRLLFMARERWVFEYLSSTCLRTKWVQRIEAKYNNFPFKTANISLQAMGVWGILCSDTAELMLYEST